MRIIRNYYNTLNNSESIRQAYIDSATLTPEKKAIYSLYKTVLGVLFFSCIYLVFVAPQHANHLKLYVHLKQFDIQVPEYKYLNENKIVKWFEEEEFEMLIRHCNLSNKSLDVYEQTLYALAHLRNNDLNGALLALNEIVNNKNNPYYEFAEIKKAYILILLKDTQGLDLLHEIVADEYHAYNAEANKMLNSEICKVLFKRVGQKYYYEKKQR